MRTIKNHMLWVCVCVNIRVRNWFGFSFLWDLSDDKESNTFWWIVFVIQIDNLFYCIVNVGWFFGKQIPPLSAADIEHCNHHILHVLAHNSYGTAEFFIVSTEVCSVISKMRGMLWCFQFVLLSPPPQLFVCLLLATKKQSFRPHWSRAVADR